jgi:hypothetical protein
MPDQKSWHDGLMNRLAYTVGLFMAAPAYALCFLRLLVGDGGLSGFVNDVGIVTIVAMLFCGMFAAAAWIDHRREQRSDSRGR